MKYHNIIVQVRTSNKDNATNHYVHNPKKNTLFIQLHTFIQVKLTIQQNLFTLQRTFTQAKLISQQTEKNSTTLMNNTLCQQTQEESQSHHSIVPWEKQKSNHRNNQITQCDHNFPDKRPEIAVQYDHNLLDKRPKSFIQCDRLSAKETSSVNHCTLNYYITEKKDLIQCDRPAWTTPTAA